MKGKLAEVSGAIDHDVPSGIWRKWLGRSLVLALLAGGNYAWWYHQPITPEQRAQLTKLVAMQAEKSGQSTRAVWERIKIEQKVRKIDALPRGRFGHLESELSQ